VLSESYKAGNKIYRFWLTGEYSNLYIDIYARNKSHAIKCFKQCYNTNYRKINYMKTLSNFNRDRVRMSKAQLCKKYKVSKTGDIVKRDFTS